jgi:hypothetical protein
VFFDQRPIKPIGFVILTIGVVVAVLRSPTSSPIKNIGKLKRKQGHRYEVLNLAEQAETY